VPVDGHVCWDMDNLWNGILGGLKACREIGKIPYTVGIDTWAVDYVLLDKDNQLIGNAVAYRDGRTEGADGLVRPFVSTEELYGKTGIQKLSFNTIYQLMAQKKEAPEDLEKAETLLMIPDYFNYLLTGVKKQEYTNATSTSLVHAKDRVWDKDLIRKLGLPEKLFGPLSMPGTVVGTFTKEIEEIVGYNSTVILPATHDTGSAYLAVPARDDEAIYLSSGTWSLLGVENKEAITTEVSRRLNFTNEGGAYDTYRYLKNIMGLWMLQSIRRELNGVAYVAGRTSKYADGRQWGFQDLIQAAREASNFPSVVAANDDSFLAPDSMIDAIKDYCRKTDQPVPDTVGQIMQCVYKSLAKCYKDTIEELKEQTGKTYTSINIVGGGCQDMYLNQMTADTCGLSVFAGPVEGTAIGNLIVQFIANREYKDLQAARDAVKKSFDIKEIWH
ncbi:MAG: rhamnulokinase, partial [Dorea sp.]|nr:rhamnulokinase [Dorea sp.]